MAIGPKCPNTRLCREHFGPELPCVECRRRAEVLDEFSDMAAPEQLKADQRREEARARKGKWDDEQAIVDAIRKLEGVTLRSCACGCKRVFQVEEYRPGRPTVYATPGCRVRAFRKRAAKLVRGQASGPLR